MAGEVKLAIILTGTMQGSQAFTKAGGGIKGIGSAIKSIGPMLALFAAQASFEFLKDSIKVTMEFEQALAEAGSIIGQTADEMKVLGKEIREMSKEIPKTPQDLGVALYDIFSAGITDTADAMNALELSAKTASAGLTSTASAARAGISTMNAFGKEASELEHIFDVQFLTIKFGILRYEELASVVGSLSPAAKAAGQSMESMFASLAILTKQGLNAAEAATALARAMEGITRPAAIKAAAELGISFIELTDDSRRAKDEFLNQKRALDDLTNSYDSVESKVKSLSEEMAKVSLEEAKNRLEISKIRRQAEKEGRDMESLTENEAAAISKLENANKDLAIQYDTISVASMEAKINSTDLSNQLDEQKKQTEASSKAFDEQIALTGNFRPLVDIIEEIGTKYGHLGEAAQADIIGKMFPQIRAKRAILSIMGNEQELMDLTDEMITQSGAMGDAFAINTDTAAAGHQLMQNSMTDLKIEMGEEMLPVMEAWHEIMRDSLIPLMSGTFIPLIKSLMPVIQSLAEIVGKLGDFFIEYPDMLWLIIGAIIAWKIAQIALNIAMFANPIGLIILAIAGLIALIILMIKHWDEISAAFQRVGDSFKAAYDSSIGPTVEAIKGAIKDIIEGWSWLGEIATMVMEGFASAYDIFIKPQLDLFVAGINLIVDALKWLWDMIVKIGEEFDNVFGGINEAITGTGEFIGGIGEGVGSLLGFADGGVVPGPLGAPMPAIVHGGERILPVGETIPVELIGGGNGTTIETHDTYNIKLELGRLPVEETPESISEKMTKALTEQKMRGATGG